MSFFDEVLSPAESLHSYLFSRTARREIGSIEGRIVDIGTDYNSPAIQLIEHKSGRKVWCQVSSMAQEQLAEDLKAGYAWEHRRVRVRGTIHHDANGKTMRLVDGVVALIEPKQVTLEELEDRDFTEGYSVSEYLDRLQEGEFGQ